MHDTQYNRVACGDLLNKMAEGNSVLANIPWFAGKTKGSKCRGSLVFLHIESIRPCIKDATLIDLSNVTAPFLEGLQEDMPDMKAKAEIDELTGTCATVTITLPRDEEILLWGKLYKKFQKVIQAADGFNIFVKTNGEISLSFDFKDVKKRIPQNQ